MLFEVDLCIHFPNTMYNGLMQIEEVVIGIPNNHCNYPKIHASWCIPYTTLVKVEGSP
jgi:hypothetical protein